MNKSINKKTFFDYWKVWNYEGYEEIKRKILTLSKHVIPHLQKDIVDLNWWDNYLFFPLSQPFLGKGLRILIIRKILCELGITKNGISQIKRLNIALLNQNTLDKYVNK